MRTGARDQLRCLGLVDGAVAGTRGCVRRADAGCAHADSDSGGGCARRRLAAPLSGSQRRARRRVRTAGCQLGRSEAGDLARRGVAYREGERAGAARHDHGRSGHACVGLGTARRLLQLQNPPVELSRRLERAGRQHRRATSRPPCRCPSASSRSIACSPPSTRASFVRRTSMASRPIRRRSSSARARPWSSTSTAIRSGVRFRATISGSPSTRTGICSSTRRRRRSTSGTRVSG